MTAPQAPFTQGPPQGRPQQQGPQPQQQQFVQQGQQQAPLPQGYYLNAPQRSPFVLSPLNWLAVVLLPLGLLIGIIIQATGAYTASANVFALLGNAAVAVGGLALVGGLIVSALNKKN